MPITTKIATVGNAAPDSAWDSHRRLSHTYLVLVSVTAVAKPAASSLSFVET